MNGAGFAYFHWWNGAMLYPYHNGKYPRKGELCWECEAHWRYRQKGWPL